MKNLLNFTWNKFAEKKLLKTYILEFFFFQIEVEELDSISLSKLEYKVAKNKAVFQKLVENPVQEYDRNLEKND